MKSLNEFFKALGDPTRLQIVRLLREKDMTPTDILQKIEISQPTLSHHLDILKRAELIEGERNGQHILYSINMGVFDMAVEFIIKFRNPRS